MMICEQVLNLILNEIIQCYYLFSRCERRIKQMRVPNVIEISVLKWMCGISKSDRVKNEYTST